jgi:hypothetical protein
VRPALAVGGRRGATKWNERAREMREMDTSIMRVRSSCPGSSNSTIYEHSSRRGRECECGCAWLTLNRRAARTRRHPHVLEPNFVLHREPNIVLHP